MNQQYQWLITGSIAGGLAVVLGAFGAHILESRLSASDIDIYETAVRYQMYHSLALILVAVLQTQMDSPLLQYAGMAFLFGIIIFSGSLYLLVLTNTRWLGAVTPLGGVGLIVGWGLLALAGLRS